MKTYYYENLTPEELTALAKRPAINFDNISEIIKPILNDIKLNGLKSALKYAKQFDGFNEENVLVTEDEFDEAEKQLEPKVKKALEIAYNNIYKFHKVQYPVNYTVETMPGVVCSREFRAIENVGLYIPGGNAVLPSTMLMLGIPAKIAGCKRVIAFSPKKDKKINNPLLYAAKLCGITEFYKIGGVQAIGLMAYGDKKIKKVAKIFGPGNQYVTAAKSFISIDPEGCAIDMPAGPSEVLVIADENANPAFVAADLLSQAEHGFDSQVILVTTSVSLAEKTKDELQIQLVNLPRKEYALKSLDHSINLIVSNIDQAVIFSNIYSPEHLILNISGAGKFVDSIINAGSVFLGRFSPEVVGDYASGTNHSLPTYGYARSFSGVIVESFMKSVSFQALTKEGLKIISETVETLADTEKLQGHKNAVSIRLNNKD